MKRTDLSVLKDSDVYSLTMFTLYKLTEIPEYSTISELPYILDYTSMLQLCQYFGGQTIKVPTTDELKSLLNLLLIYQEVNIKNKTLEEVIKDLGYNSNQLGSLINSYNKICEIINTYDIKGRTNYE